MSWLSSTASRANPPKQHLTALRLHAVNREQYPRFYRGRYRLGMSLEMIADPGFRFTDREAARDDLAEILAVLHRCRLTENQLRADDEIRPVSGGGGYSELTPALRLELLKAAQQELRGVRRQLTLAGRAVGDVRAPSRACHLADLPAGGTSASVLPRRRVRGRVARLPPGGG